MLNTVISSSSLRTLAARWLGGKGSSGWTAVDAGVDGLYGVSVLPPLGLGGRPQVIKCGAVPGGQIEANAVVKLSSQISAPGCAWTLSLARKAYTILVVPEPSVEPEEIDQSVRWSIGSMVDYPITEAHVAWMRIPTVKLLPNRPPHLYVVAARNDTISAYEAVFQKAHLPLQAIDVRETAQRNIAALAEKPSEGIGLLLIGQQGVQFTVTFNGELYLDRFVEESLFADALNDADARGRAWERVLLQVQRSLDFISRNLPFVDVGRILMAPMPSHLGLMDYIAQHLTVPVEKLDLASLFDFSKTPELAKEENQARYFFALGSALRFMKS